MKLLSMKFWINLILVVATTYIITWYLLTPSNNQCQMTFMMEPPKFIPVPVDDIDTPADSDLNYPEIELKGAKQKPTSYKLFMYSEFGFPQASNVRRDLKDSMPVLFVPGNAGSYQQVRSLASTCIRHQLQSLDAFKFIFYTIDFQGQLSGISGKLIEDQTLYVQKALNQIAKMHPTETHGIILIGHSVGGFISKVLFTLPSFDPESVPLLISLASPLTSPYLTFDNKMRELYERTNSYWANFGSKRNSSISISISGGKPDRLVPMHLSIDPHYDLSLTTSSMKDVWLTTDHVCITWCKELMHKLSNLLSALMDKKQTRLISDRESAMSIIKKELLVSVGDTNLERKDVILRDWKSIRPHKVIDFEEYYFESRSHLRDSMTLLRINQSQHKDILIIIDYIEALKENGVFGCQAINSTNNQINCIGRSELMHFAHVIPSRRFEPKRLALRLDLGKNYQINYLVFDFLSYATGYSNSIEHRLPELLTVQKLDSNEHEKSIYIPTVFEYLFKKFFFIDKFHYEISPHKAFPLIHLRYKVVNLKQETQIYSIKYESHSCIGREYPREATVLLTQGGYLTESFHPVAAINNKNILSIDIKIASQPTMEINIESQARDNQSYIDFYIDGTCKNTLDIELDILALVVDLIQKRLGILLTSATLFSYLSVISSAYRLVNYQQVTKTYLLSGDSTSITGIASFILIYAVSGYQRLESRSLSNGNYFDLFVSMMLINVLSHGVVAFLDCFIKRVIDLAVIINNTQSLLRNKVGSKGQDRANGLSTDSRNSTQPCANGSSPKVNNQRKSIRTDFDWLIVTVAISTSFILSSALMVLFILFIIIKLKLFLETVNDKKDANSTEAVNKRCSQANQPVNQYKFEHLNELVSDMAVLIVLALISTIPAALIRINSNKLTLTENVFNSFCNDMSFLATASTLISVKVISEIIETMSIDDQTKMKQNATNKRRPFTGFLYSFLGLFSGKQLHLLTLAPIMMIESNLCYSTIASSISMAWLSGYLLVKRTSGTHGHDDKD